ncbi:MAG TPA: alpha/beta hydrolase, partial [Paraburkholderia sp.]
MASLDTAPQAQNAVLPPRSLAARLGITSVSREALRRRYTRSGSKFVSIMGTDVHYVDEGSGELLVM